MVDGVVVDEDVELRSEVEVEPEPEPDRTRGMDGRVAVGVEAMVDLPEE